MAYRTEPLPVETMPPGISCIIGNEAAERFSYYGMRAVLVTFMTKYLLDSTGQPAPLTEDQAKFWYHLLTGSAYLFPILGALLADTLWGKYRTIMTLSMVYVMGHVALALNETFAGLITGLALIAIGAGGIKPCVSAHVGDQFGSNNKHLLEKAFGFFYVSINVGAFLSTLLTPWLLADFPNWLQENTQLLEGWTDADVRRLGPHFAFGVPGVLMMVATLVFWLGRRSYAHIPPKGGANVFRSLSGEGGTVLLRLAPVYMCVAVFWSLYDQSASAWVLQAGKMDRRIDFFGLVTWEPKPDQVQAINPLLILIYVPLAAYVVYPLLQRALNLTPLRKITLGMVLTAGSFFFSAMIQGWIDRGLTPHVGWQLAAFGILTFAEVMVSVVGLEFSYAQAPPELKSIVMSVWLLTVFVGNQFTAAVNYLMTQYPDIKQALDGAAYYSFFGGLMLATSVVMGVYSGLYHGKQFLPEGQAAP
jgi:proton-dependent oligopeptide transporter, POT family